MGFVETPSPSSPESALFKHVLLENEMSHGNITSACCAFLPGAPEPRGQGHRESATQGLVNLLDLEETAPSHLCRSFNQPSSSLALNRRAFDPHGRAESSHVSGLATCPRQFPLHSSLTSNGARTLNCRE